MAESDADRQERLYKEDPGAISVRRLEMAQATREEARSKVRGAEAELRMALEAAGEAGDANAQIQGARAALDKAELDLANTHVLAPARGTVTDLRTDVGHFVQPGAPVMTLVADHDLWISADMTENNLGHIDVGDEAAIVLDVLPGQVLEGPRAQRRPRRRQRPAVAVGIAADGARTIATGCARPSAFPVSIEFDPDEVPRLKRARVGGQAEVLVYAGRQPADEPPRRDLHPRRELADLPLLRASREPGRQGGSATGDRARPRRARRVRAGPVRAVRRLRDVGARAEQAGSAAAAGQRASSSRCCSRRWWRRGS